jgi:16S rRNA (guanine527-N7)-methyltransferase
VLPEEQARFQLSESVPRETMERLSIYVSLLTQWQGRLNLISPLTLGAIWHRHVFDSFQLRPLVPEGASKWIDMGSGAGFPGLVIAILDARMIVTLVESRAKKCAFLQTVIEALDLSSRVTVEDRRLEAMSPRHYDVISARALAPLPKLFELGMRFASATTQWILPKGRQAGGEIDHAKRLFSFEHQLVASRTDPEARIVLARHVKALAKK